MADEQPLLSPSDAEEAGLGTTFPPPAGLKKSPGVPKMGIEHCLVATFLPWLMFTLVVTLFIFLYYDAPFLVGFLICACVLLVMGLVFLGVGQSRRVHIAIGLLCILAICIGASVGYCTFHNYASTYWLLEDGNVFHDVSPSSTGANYPNATLIGFSQDAFVDTQRTIGYMENGVVYCVAPISSRNWEQQREQRWSAGFYHAPQYWAAGIDCCDQRSGFRCGDTDARDFGQDTRQRVVSTAAKGGLRIWDNRDRERFNTAIQMAESVYDLCNEKRPTIGRGNEIRRQCRAMTGRYSLTWIATGNNPKDDLWESCMIILALTSSLYFICSLAAALILRKSRLFEQ